MIEVAPLHCVIEISKSAGELATYKKVSVCVYMLESLIYAGYNPDQAKFLAKLVYS